MSLNVPSVLRLARVFPLVPTIPPTRYSASLGNSAVLSLLPVNYFSRNILKMPAFELLDLGIREFVQIRAREVCERL